MQLASIGVTLAFAVVGGLITGYIIHIDWIFSILKDHELFDDSEFFAGLEDEEGDSPVTGQLNISSVEQTFATELNKQDILNGDYVGKMSLDDPAPTIQPWHRPGVCRARRVSRPPSCRGGSATRSSSRATSPTTLRNSGYRELVAASQHIY